MGVVGWHQLSTTSPSSTQQTHPAALGGGKCNPTSRARRHQRVAGGASRVGATSGVGADVPEFRRTLRRPRSSRYFCCCCCYRCCGILGLFGVDFFNHRRSTTVLSPNLPAPPPPHRRRRRRCYAPAVVGILKCIQSQKSNIKDTISNIQSPRSNINCLIFPKVYLPCHMCAGGDAAHHLNGKPLTRATFAAHPQPCWTSRVTASNTGSSANRSIKRLKDLVSMDPNINGQIAGVQQIWYTTISTVC